jgi:hypothetical protein
MVPIELLREAFERSGITRSELARRMGWLQPQAWRVSRALGYSVDTNSRGVRKQPREHVTLAMAYRLIEAMNVDPIDIDI